MKKCIKQNFFAKFILVSLILFSCSKKIDLIHFSETNKFQADNFLQAGIMHNKNLDSIFVKLKSGNSSNPFVSLSLNKSNDIALESNQVMALSIAKNVSLKQINNDPNLSSALKQEMIAVTNSIYNDVAIINKDNIEPILSNSALTNDQLHFISELNTILSDNDELLESILNRISYLEYSIYQSNLSQQEQASLFIITNTAKSSLSYWNINIANWSSFISETSISSTPSNTARFIGLTVQPNISNKITWKKVAKADVGGAVAGVAAWRGAALLGGPITLAAFGSSVGGWAAGCSAYEALMQLW